MRSRPATALCPKKLLGISRWIASLLPLALFTPGVTSAGDDFCALTLTVSNSDGSPIRSTWIELISPAGETVLRTMMRGATLKICDFGFGKHELRVGTNECHPITISNIVLHLGYPEHLRVKMLDCSKYPPISTGCDAYFRVKSADGKRLQGVTVRSSNAYVKGVTDSYGRVELPIKRAGRAEFTFSLPGYETNRLELQCKSVETIDREVVMLKKERSRGGQL